MKSSARLAASETDTDTFDDTSGARNEWVDEGGAGEKKPDKQELGHGGGSRSDEIGWRKLEEEKKPNAVGGGPKSQEGGQEEDEERRSEDLASVRGPTGRWNPRSRLIAIKAPLRLRL
ncbi:hypothetical protein ALC56_07789 [Trachymyrmex septentrionalis]|uniref:Uncharacterized protein n=1 Tax=Trachymyrmex septentrionalis TaxID=34720 RepID=A0A195FAD9_9HYME|nr:hypothetical protein ALC56_07789 [Trachymyrmex septentrionalis]